MTLLEKIASWDNKSAAALQSTCERHSGEEDFLATILEHIADVDLQRVATWPAFSTKSAVISTLSTALVSRRPVLTSRPFWGWGVLANVWSSGIGIGGARWLRRARSARWAW